jgi:hypothetical protein
MNLKKILAVGIMFGSAVLLAGCENASVTTWSNTYADFTNTCEMFDADFIYSATGKSVAYMDSGILKDPAYCTYYFEYSKDYYKLPNGTTSPGGPWISLKLENMDFAKQKTAYEFLEYSVVNDPGIGIENATVYLKEKKLIEILLSINPARFIALNRASEKAFSEEEMKGLARRIAEKINGKLSFDIKKNPNNLVVPEVEKKEVGDLQQAFAVQFWGKIAEQKIDEALAMMDANQPTKDMWRTNFKTIKSISVKKTEKAFEDEWTATRQTYKMQLDVSVPKEGEGYGWQNGLNFRWVTLEKTGNTWQIHEIANNP